MCLPRNFVNTDRSTQVLVQVADALGNQDKFSEAVPMFTDALAVQRRLVGPDHPDTLTMTMNFGLVLKSQGKHTEAETIYREVLTVQRRVLGPEHPSTL